jgi:hypothetical protein
MGDDVLQDLLNVFDGVQISHLLIFGIVFFVPEILYIFQRRCQAMSILITWFLLASHSLLAQRILFIEQVLHKDGVLGVRSELEGLANQHLHSHLADVLDLVVMNIEHLGDIQGFEEGFIV